MENETTTENPPNQTLYINNLNEKVKIDELKQSLYYLCSEYGEILDIVAKKNIRMRGQAFVIFKDVTAATSALKALQGFNFFDKSLKVTFARQKSDVIAKQDGTFVPREKPKRIEEQKIVSKKPRTDGDASNQLGKAAKDQRAQQKSNIIVPNNILFAENLPPMVTTDMLTALFQQYIGFREVRLINTKNVAFVEYDDELQAGIALSGLNGFQMTPECSLQISYAKK